MNAREHRNTPNLLHGIRYVTDDIATSDEDVSASSSGLVAAHIDGRQHEFVYSSTNRPVSMTALNIHTDQFDEIERFQFSQKQKGLVSFEYSSNSELTDKQKSSIFDLLSSKLGDGFELRIGRISELKLSKSGKQSFLRQEITQSK